MTPIEIAGAILFIIVAVVAAIIVTGPHENID